MDAIKEANEALRKFTSGNDTPVTRATITQEELKAICIAFYDHWHNTAGASTEHGFDDWYKKRMTICWAIYNGVGLSHSDLSNADLSGTDLSNADLSNADLSGTDLGNADLSNANLSGAKLINAILPDRDIPMIEDIHKKLYEAVTGDNLHMNSWHGRGSCGTTHCLAGWVVTLAGEAGVELEKEIGTNAAAALIYQKSDPQLEQIPDFYADTSTALKGIKEKSHD